MVKMLLDRGADPNFIHYYADKPNIILHHYVENGDEAMGRLLLEYGVYPDNVYSVPRAQYLGYSAILELLTSAAGDEIYGEKELSQAALNGDIEFVEKCLSKGADLNTPILIDNPPETVLFTPNVDNRITGYYTPFSYAAMGSHIDIMKLILENGFDTGTMNREKLTSLSVAAIMGDLEAAVMLVDAGADINKGAPLVHAVLFNNWAMVNLLLESGADITISAQPVDRFRIAGYRFPHGRFTPLQVAVRENFYALRDLIEEH